METTEIMTTNEEVIEQVTDEIATTDSGTAWKTLGTIGLVVLAGVGIYKFVVKPCVAKYKAKKEAEQAESEVIDCEDFTEKAVDEETID